MDLTPTDRERLSFAKRRLTRHSLAARMAELIGTPIERGLAMLPAPARRLVDRAASQAVKGALDVAIASLGRGAAVSSSDRFHKGVAALAGGVGGAFGLPALLLELPFSTTLMLRAIADIAREHGEDVGNVSTKLACVQVFALGGPQAPDDAADASYYATRMAISRLTADAAKHIAAKGLSSHEAPAVVRFISAVATRFGLVVTEKAVAAALPAVGAIGGAAVNTIFMEHFQELARGHFTVRALERQYDEESVKAAYDLL